MKIERKSRAICTITLGMSAIVLLTLAAPAARADPMTLNFSWDFSLFNTGAINNVCNSVDPCFTNGRVHIQAVNGEITTDLTDIQLPVAYAPAGDPIGTAPCSGGYCPVSAFESLGFSWTGLTGGFGTFGFGPDTTPPATPPATPPIISLGTFGAAPALGQELSVSGSLWAYDNPIQVGTFTLTATVIPASVPEPSSVGLLSLAVGAVIAAKNRRSSGTLYSACRRHDGPQPARGRSH
jgi:hypothetical protein